MEICVSNLSSPIGTIFGGANAHRRFLEETGYDGYELTPVFSAFLGQLIFNGTGADMIHSLHQSFRSHTVGSIFQGQLSSIIQLAEFTLPHSNTSIDIMQKVQEAHRRYVPDGESSSLLNVLYPKNVGQSAAELSLSGIKTFQPEPMLGKYWGIKGSRDFGESLVEAAAEHGFDGMTLDTFHWQREQGGYRLPAFETVIDALRSHNFLQQIHYSPYRPDSGDSPDSLNRMLRGQLDLMPHREILLQAAPLMESNANRVVVEIPATAAFAAELTAFHKHICALVRDQLTD